jgi:hypothetical protein
VGKLRSWADLEDVAVEGAIAVANTGIIGTTKTYYINADTSDPSGTAEVLTSATGWKELWIYPLAALSAATPVYVGFSTTASDGTAVAEQINSAITASGTGGQDGYDVITLTPDYPIAHLVYDGITTYKTIAAETTSAAKKLCVIGVS